MSAFAENVRHDIERDGLSVIYVGDETPPFAYTVGLWERSKHPELIIFGLSDRAMANILNRIGGLINDGARFERSTKLANVGGKFGVAVQPAHEKYLDRYFGFAVGFYQTVFPIAQVVWPDSDGRFPGDAKYNKAYAKLQPVLE